MMTGHTELEAAVEAMRAGAVDFITKPVDPQMLHRRLERVVEHRVLSRELSRVKEQLARSQGPTEMVGNSRPMTRVYDLLQRVAPSDASVLLLGESGTGKELAARALHSASPRSEGPFVALNCAAVPPSLIESELFGHVAGAFTDARQSKDGLFLEANGGTLFLDEVGELPLELQPKLLRALQEQTVRPVGGTHEVPFDARLVTATNVDLDSKVEDGSFREDLFYRIDVVRITLPPLRDRGNDVLLLAQHMIDQRRADSSDRPAALSDEAASLMLAYDWPGNVRELENCIERAMALARHRQIAPDDLPAKVRDHRDGRVALSFDDAQDLVSLEELEGRYIAKVLEMVGGNKSEAARVLGIDRRSLYRRLEKYEIE
jgi:two-component system response regulator HydG